MLYLNSDELFERTGKKHRKKQCAELARQGVVFTIRGDGFPLVLRSTLEAPADKKRKREPNFGALRQAG